MKKVKKRAEKRGSRSRYLAPPKTPKNYKSHNNYNNYSYDTKSKVILASFLVFSILVMMFLFKAPFTGRTTLTTEMKTQYNASEPFSGSVKLGLQNGDLLPPNTNILFLIYGNSSKKCPTYLCNNIPITWYKYNKTLDKCVLTDADPEGTCCIMSGKDCKQVIINSGFEKTTGNIPFGWIPKSGVSNIGTEYKEIYDPTYTKLIFNSSVVYLDTQIAPSYYQTQGKSGLFNVSIYQDLTSRAINVCKENWTPGPWGKWNETCSKLDLNNESKFISRTRNLTDANNCSSQIKHETQTISCANCSKNVNCTEWLPDCECCSETVNGAVPISCIGHQTLSCNATNGCVIPYTESQNYNCNCHGNLLSSSPSNITQDLKFSSFTGNAITNGYAISDNNNNDQDSQGNGNIILKYKLGYETYTSGGCAFEVIVKTQSDKEMHYWYTVPGAPEECQMPLSNDNITYINKSSEIPSMSASYSSKIKQFKINLSSDFDKKNWKKENITSIWLVSYGYYDNLTYETYGTYGQSVFFDDVRLEKGALPSNSCEARDQECCVEGTGLGNYFPELNCPTGECWSKCTPSINLTLTQFRILSTTPNKMNMTSGMFAYAKEVSEQTQEEKDKAEGNIVKLNKYGNGYSACQDFTKPTCKDWDNIYEVLLNNTNSIFGNLNFKAPSQNGTYKFVVKVQYLPQTVGEGCGPYYNESCLIYQTSKTFYVGNVNVSEPAPQCLDSDYNCTDAVVVQNWSSWSACQNGMQTRVKMIQCTYSGNEACPQFRNMTQTESQNCTTAIPCDASDYNCSDWTPKLCSPGSTQARTCDLIGACDPNLASSYSPDTEKNCSTNSIISYIQEEKANGVLRKEVKNQLLTAGWTTDKVDYLLNTVYGGEEPKSGWPGWLVWAIITIVLVAVVLLIITKVVLPKGKGKRVKVKESYPELTSYIKDAFATGATRPEITAKLVEAGWPRSSIDAAFRSIK